MSERKRIGLREVRALQPAEIVWDAAVTYPRQIPHGGGPAALASDWPERRAVDPGERAPRLGASSVRWCRVPIRRRRNAPRAR
jgi:hypothetical protein